MKKRYIGSTGKAQVQNHNKDWTSYYFPPPVKCAGYVGADIRYTLTQEEQDQLLFHGHFMKQWRELRRKP